MRLMANEVLLTTNKEKVTILDCFYNGKIVDSYHVKMNDKPYTLHYLSNLSDKEHISYELIHKYQTKQVSAFPKIIALTTLENDRFGYIVDTLGSDFIHISSFFDRSHSYFSSKKILFIACFHLAELFLTLEKEGLSFQNYDSLNIYINKRTGQLISYDFGNLSYADKCFYYHHDIRFSSPEMINDNSNTNLSSDRFMLASLLFRLIYQTHPFEGKLWANMKDFSSQKLNDIYGLNATFILDEFDETNRPIKGFHNELLFSKDISLAVLKLFQKAFSKDAIKNKKRVDAFTFMKEFAFIVSSYVICPYCKKEEFYFNDFASFTCSNSIFKKKVNFEYKLIISTSIDSKTIFIKNGSSLFNILFLSSKEDVDSVHESFKIKENKCSLILTSSMNDNLLNEKEIELVEGDIIALTNGTTLKLLRNSKYIDETSSKRKKQITF